MGGDGGAWALQLCFLPLLIPSHGCESHLMMTAVGAQHMLVKLIHTHTHINGIDWEETVAKYNVYNDLM